MLTNKVVCPNCGSAQIEGVESYDTYDCNKGIKKRFVGWCEDCDTQLQWSEIYHFVGYDEIEED